MNEIEKAKVDKIILDAINSVVGKDNPQDAALYVRGDSKYQKASFYIKGHPMVLASTIHHHMTANEEFRRFMLAAIGSFVAKNPQAEREFMTSVNLVKQTPGVN